jgi:hypothetical protein
MTTDETETALSSSASSERTIHREWTEFDHPTTAIVESLAEVLETDPMDVPPLHDYVDTDALNALVTSPTDDGSVTVSFTHERARVLVDSDGHLTLYVRGEE